MDNDFYQVKWSLLSRHYDDVMRQKEKIFDKMGALAKEQLDKFIGYACFRYQWAHNLHWIMMGYIELTYDDRIISVFNLSKYKTFPGLARAVNKQWRKYND